MYSDWTSFTVQLSSLAESNQSVLTKLPSDDALKVVNCVAKTVASQLGLASPQDAKPSTLSKEEEITWFMEVICYGLSLPLTEHDTVKDCVNVYCEWLSALLPEPKTCVPGPIIEEANRFTRKIINHLYHLFVPRAGEAQETIHRQAVLCHRVLRRLQDVVQQSKTIDRDTWETLLGFLLAINDALLAPPAVKDDVGDQLSERVLGVLYEIWLVACVKCYPSPSLWKTFREMAANWRHRMGLVDQWNRVCIALTKKLISFMYGPQYLENAKKTNENDTALGLVISEEMTNECVAQTWYCFLHSLGNPTDLSRPILVSQTQSFYQYAIVAEDVIDPTHHPCLSALPEIFNRAMKGLAAIVDTFLGTSKDNSRVHHPNRPRCNSILHLLGVWLMEASLIGSNYLVNNSVSVPTSSAPEPTVPETPPVFEPPSKPVETSHSKLGLFRKTSTSIPPSNVSVSTVSTAIVQSTTSGLELPEALTPEWFSSGRAEAIGALCRIFCAKKTGEDISPIYLARFYVALHEGLSNHEGSSSDVVAKIMTDGKDLLLVDLDGSLTLMPKILTALELVLPQESKNQELRSAAIYLLGSLLPYPSHYHDLPIKELIGNEQKAPVYFGDLQDRILELLFDAIQVETVAKNVQHLLGGLMFLVLDFAKREERSNEEAHVSNGGNTMDSAHAVFVKATHLVCHRLIASWRYDLNTSLAALELLGGLARTEIPLRGALECKRTVKWLCDFIVTQCSRPPPAHSKDLHSTIVAAFYCCRTWILHHPYLLQDKECFATVMEVVELGISGQKSIPKVSASGSDVLRKPIMKEEKLLSPASRRVKDAAESLLITLLEQVDGIPPCPASKRLADAKERMMSTIVTEETDFYRYFVVDNSIILAMIEEPVENELNPRPTVSVILRGPSNKSTWTMQLRHLPRYKSGMKTSLSNLGRPLAMDETLLRPSVQPSFFPETVDKIPLCNADKSIPAVESVALDERAILELDDLSRIVMDQTNKEMIVSDHEQEEGLNYHVETECEPPEVCTEFYTARLVLNHLGFFSPAALKESMTSPMPKIIALNSEGEEFRNDMKTLDELSTKTVDNVYVYYVKNGQKDPEEILQNLTRGQLHQHFIKFLSSLGHPISSKHMSFDKVHDEFMDQDMSKALYWADASSEIMFFVPSLLKAPTSPPTKSESAGNRLVKRQISMPTVSDVRILIVWLESHEDFQHFPFEQITGGISNGGGGDVPVFHKNQECFTIFIHELKSGLLRINIKTRGIKSNLSSPLVDGMVVSRRSVGPLVRQTALNVATRKRLEQENYQPAHVRRRLKIQELAFKYRCSLTTSEFYANMI